jgi:hypothetical protein
VNKRRREKNMIVIWGKGWGELGVEIYNDKKEE